MLKQDQDKQIKNKQEEKIAEFQKREAEDLAKILSQKYKVPYADLSRITIELDALRLISKEQATEGKLAIFQKIGKNISAAVFSPNFKKTKEILDNLKNQGYFVQVFIVSEFSLERALNKYKEIPIFTEATSGLVRIAEQKLRQFQEEISSLHDLKQTLLPFLVLKEQRKISDILEIILAGGLNLEASDIHLEPEEKMVRLRLRLDGVLQEAAFLPHSIYNLLLSRIKLVSELKLNIHDSAQDGRFTIRFSETDIEVRTSVLPGPYGESISLRLLNPKTIGLFLEDLGMQTELLDVMKKELKKSNGMILTTGPTGSGKTTTLYAFVKKVKTSGIKIITIEDPIEYHLSGITQTQVDPQKGYDFLTGLRSALRQDPDMILIGEIRDLETAKTAMHASLTGHLVFSTLHTNNAAGAIPRLIDLGVKPEIIAPAINVVLAQRLIRKLCVFCRKEEKPNNEEAQMIKKNLDKMPKNYKIRLLDEIKIFRPSACPKCSQMGYRGRIGIFEAILINEEAERLILGARSPSEVELNQILTKQGTLTMFQDGLVKVLNGISSLEELERVAGSN